jgi:hypothetical protein
MSEFFNVVSLSLNGLLNLTNLSVGILLSWSLFGIPLLFYLITVDFLYTLLDTLGIIKPE